MKKFCFLLLFFTVLQLNQSYSYNVNFSSERKSFPADSSDFKRSFLITVHEEKNIFKTIMKYSAIALGVSAVGCFIYKIYKKRYFSARLKELLKKDDNHQLVSELFDQCGHLFKLYNSLNTGISTYGGSFNPHSMSISSIDYIKISGLSENSAAIIDLKERIYKVVFDLVKIMKSDNDFRVLMKEIENSIFSFSIEDLLFDILIDINFMLTLN